MVPSCEFACICRMIFVECLMIPFVLLEVTCRTLTCPIACVLMSSLRLLFFVVEPCPSNLPICLEILALLPSREVSGLDCFLVLARMVVVLLLELVDPGGGVSVDECWRRLSCGVSRYT